MTIWVLFVLVFVGGPVIFRLLTQGTPTVAHLRWLGIFVAACALAGLGIRFVIGLRWGQNPGLTLTLLALIWFAWIGALAFGAQAIRRRKPGLSVRRWTGVTGALATTVPWFCLASADMFAG